MSVELIRIDDRLIHGQVTCGWVPALEVDRIVICDNEIATNDWERSIYNGAVQPGTTVDFLTVAETAAAMKVDAFRQHRTLILVEGTGTVVDLVAHGAPLHRVNVGGLHYKPRSAELLPYVHIDATDRKNFAVLRDHDVALECRDTPSGRMHNLYTLLDKHQK